MKLSWGSHLFASVLRVSVESVGGFWVVGHQAVLAEDKVTINIPL